MKGKKKHIIILAVLHILILLFPLGAKISHHHHTGEYGCCEHQQAAFLNNQIEHCLVCDFEFLPFESSQPFKLRHGVFANCEFRFSHVDKPFFEHFNYSSLRAPPLS